MKKYIAAKHCNFGGKAYMIGETIPTELIDPNRAPTLVKYGTIFVIAVLLGMLAYLIAGWGVLGGLFAFVATGVVLSYALG